MKISQEFNCDRCELKWIEISDKVGEEILDATAKIGLCPSYCMMKLLNRINKEKWKWFADKKMNFVPCAPSQMEILKEMMKIVNGEYELE